MVRLPRAGLNTLTNYYKMRELHARGVNMNLQSPYVGAVDRDEFNCPQHESLSDYAQCVHLRWRHAHIPRIVWVCTHPASGSVPTLELATCPRNGA